jgi:hypothetical protein
VDFQIDFGSRPLTPAAAAPLLYASVPGRASSLGNGEVVFYDEASERTHVMTEQVLGAMDLCRQFRPLDAHVQSIIAAQPALAGQQAAVRRVLEGLGSRGLLLTDQQLATRFDAVAAEPETPFAGVFIRAFNRPTQLGRLLESLLAYEHRFGARRRYVLIDDSSEPAALAAHRDLARDFAKRSGAPVVLMDRSHWDGVIDAASSALPTHAAAVAWLLARTEGRFGGGAGRNLSLLLSAGRRFAQLDDDFVLPLHRHPDYQPGLVFDKRGWNPRTFVDLRSALAAGTPEEIDPFALHLALCGQRLGRIAKTVPGCALDSRHLRELDFSRNRLLFPHRRVRETVNGHRGQSGAESLSWMFLLPPAASAAMRSSRETFLASLEDPAIWHGTSSFHIAARSNYSSFCIDNARLMPCVNPVGRGEDALFSSLASLMHPEDVVIDVPYAIAHVQEAARDRRATLGKPERPPPTTVFADFARDVTSDLRAEDPARRLAGFASRLRDLAAAGERGLQSYLGEYLAYRRSRMIAALQSSLANASDVPEGWATEVKRMIEVNARALGEGGTARLAGWPQDADAATCANLFRNEADALASALEAWPALWEWGREHGEALLDRHRVDA